MSVADFTSAMLEYKHEGLFVICSKKYCVISFYTSKHSTFCICRLHYHNHQHHHQGSTEREIVAKNLMSLEEMMREISVEFSPLEDFRHFCS